MTLRSLCRFFASILFATAAPAFATDVSGVIGSDTIWTAASSPYTVVGSVTVAAGATLTVEPGVTVDFVGSTKLTVDGTLTAVGTPEQPIVFNGGGIGGEPVTIESDILIDDATGDTRISFAVIRHFYDGLVIGSSCEISNNIIQQNRESGIVVLSDYDYPDPLVRNNLIIDNRFGIYLVNSNSVREYAGTYEYNTIARNSDAGFKAHDFYGHCDPITVSHSIIAFNGFGLLKEMDVVVSDHNVVFGNGVAYHPAADIPSPDDLHDDPLFNDPLSWDFSLCTCSGALAAGTDGGEVGALGAGGVLPDNPRVASTTPTTSGSLIGDEIWSGAVTITDTVVVPQEFVLVIEPGTDVSFVGDAGMDVLGVLSAVGTGDSMIALTGGGAAGAVAAGSRIWLNGHPGQSRVSYCRISHFFEGITAEQSCSGSCFISHNIFENNQSFALHIVSTYAGSYPVVTGNVFDGNLGGIVLSQTNSNKDVFGTYEYNTIVNNTDKGFYLYDMYGSHTITVRNSIIAGNEMGIGAWAGGVSSIVFSSEHNDVWANSTADYFSYWSTFGPGPGDIAAAPLFADPAMGNYSLLPGSPALTAGVNGDQIGAHGRAPEPVDPVFCDGFESGDAGGWS